MTPKRKGLSPALKRKASRSYIDHNIDQTMTQSKDGVGSESQFLSFQVMPASRSRSRENPIVLSPRSLRSSITMEDTKKRDDTMRKISEMRDEIRSVKEALETINSHQHSINHKKVDHIPTYEPPSSNSAAIPVFRNQDSIS